MSHFTVMVVGDDPHEQLALFQENNMGDCPKKYLAFNDTETECRKDYEAESEETKREYPTFEEYIEGYHGYKRDPQIGKYGYWENPNAKWDWYQVGGRWAGFLQIKPKFESLYRDEASKSHICRVNSAKKGHIDLDGMMNQAGDEASKEWDAVNKHIFKDLPPHTPWSQFRNSNPSDETRKQYWTQPRCAAWKKVSYEEKQRLGINAYPLNGPDDYLLPREKHVAKARAESITTFAFLRDGKWTEKGKMGWWAYVADEKENWPEQFSKLLSQVPDDATVTVVDCHT